MNLNQSLFGKKSNERRNMLGMKFQSKNLMGPPKRLAPKRKANSTLSSATNWGRSMQSVQNTSTMRSPSTTDRSIMDNDYRIIIALTEGRGEARCEVGIACISTALPALTVCQISDLQSYINTLTKINIMNPTDIIVPATFTQGSNNRLVEKLKQNFPNVKIMSVPRKSFNKTNGMDRIVQLCLPSYNSICLGLQHKYYGLAAASALITYLQSNLFIFYANESLKVDYQESEGYAIIDIGTADRLELVSSTKPNQASRFSTLFGVLNRCYTKTGARSLRSTILQPPCLPSLIEIHSKCVDELIRNPQILLSIQATVQKISHIDQLLAITTMSFGTNSNCSIRQLNYLLFLNGLVDLVEPLRDALLNCQQPFYKDLKNTLESDNFNDIKNLIRTTIRPSAHMAKGEAGINARCFAIQSGINGLLDLVRKVYSERLEDMREYVKMLANKYNLTLTLNNNNTKGYHIVLKLTNQQKRFMKPSELAPEFIQVHRLAGSFTMKTVELINLSTRLEDILMEILKISNMMIEKTICELKQYISFFYKLCEDVGKLDMLQSLAEVSICNKYTRPKFGEYTELAEARHPMLELLIDETLVPNRISICQDFNVQIITGPNGSGKSIYIRQVMLLQIMAQVGCYVPADSATFRPIDRMFARVYLEDNMNQGASAFVLEMKEVQYMMTLLSDNSLFIVDELCRSTSAEEGAAIAMAICERFCATNAFLYITTHYTTLTKVYDLYLNVKLWQMETISEGETPQELSLDFQYKLVPGVTELKHYGVYTVRSIWPQALLEDVYKILETLKRSPKNIQCVALDDEIRIQYKTASDLNKIKKKKGIRSNKSDKVTELRDEFTNLNVGSTRTLLSNRESPIVYTNTNTTIQNISNFLREDTDNINKLVPEINLECLDEEVILLYSNQTNDSYTQEQNSFKLELMDDDLESIAPSFEFSQNPPITQIPKPQHIIPNVLIVEGPNPPTPHSSFEMEREPTFDEEQLEELLTFTESMSSPYLKNTTVEINLENEKSDSKTTKESDSFSSPPKKLKKNVKQKRFVPPRKLTKKEIEEEFNAQDRKIYESASSSSDVNKYLSHFLNRPSVKQVQKSKHLAFVRRTEEGVEVFPAKPELPKRVRTPFKRQLSSSTPVDVTIFSDNNAEMFDEFVNSNERDIKRFKFNPSKTLNFHFNSESISEYAFGTPTVKPFDFSRTNPFTTSSSEPFLLNHQSNNSSVFECQDIEFSF